MVVLKLKMAGWKKSDCLKDISAADSFYIYFKSVTWLNEDAFLNYQKAESITYLQITILETRPTFKMQPHCVLYRTYS